MRRLVTAVLVWLALLAGAALAEGAWGVFSSCRLQTMLLLTAEAPRYSAITDWYSVPSRPKSGCPVGMVTTPRCSVTGQ